ncbi:radical SAM protein [bacterium]|nr:radical SAM protein [bacterium]
MSFWSDLSGCTFVGIMSYLKLRDRLVQRFGKEGPLKPAFELAQGVDFGRRYLWYEHFGRDRHRPSTRELFVEWVNYCNLRCAFCALDHGAPKQRMNPGTWAELLRQLVEDRRWSKLERLHLHNGGETLLHPLYATLFLELDRWRQLGLERNGRFPEVRLLTNGMLLDEGRRSAILSTKALTHIGLSMDGGTPEAYERMRVRADWERFTTGVLALLEENAVLAQPKKIFLISAFQTREELDENRFDRDFKRILHKADQYELRLIHDWGGQLEGVEGVPSSRSKPHKWGCNMMLDQLVVFPEGKVGICCNDLNARSVVGNIHEEGLYGAYASPQRKQWLRLMARNRHREIPICAGCERF